MDDLKGNKRRIYEYIEKNPGRHMREIKRSLGLSMGDVQYNLYSLEKLGYIVSFEEGAIQEILSKEYVQ